MNKFLIVIFLLPVLLQSQNQDNWLTPFADVKFENGKIVYAFNASPDMVICKIKPLYFSQSLMVLKPGLNMPSLNPEDVIRQQKAIREYLGSTSLNKLESDLQKEYLRLVAMVLIWDLELDDHTILELTNIKNTNNEKLINQAQLILELQRVYKSVK